MADSSKPDFMRAWDVKKAEVLPKLCIQNARGEWELRPKVEELIRTLRDAEWRQIVCGRRVHMRSNFTEYIYGMWGTDYDVHLRTTDDRLDTVRHIRYTLQLKWLTALNAVLPIDNQLNFSDLLIQANCHRAEASEEKEPDTTGVETPTEMAARKKQINKTLTWWSNDESAWREAKIKAAHASRPSPQTERATTTAPLL